MTRMERPLRIAFSLTISAFAILFLTMFAVVGHAAGSVTNGVATRALDVEVLSCSAALLLVGSILFEFRLFRSADAGRRVGLSVLALLQLGMAAFAAWVFFLGVKA